MTPSESYKRFGTITLSADVIRVLMRVDSSEGLDRSAMDLSPYSNFLPKDFQHVFERQVVPKLQQRFLGQWVGRKEMSELARMIESEMSRLIIKPTIDEKARRRDEKALKVFGSPAFEAIFELINKVEDGSTTLDMEIITPEDPRFEALKPKGDEKLRKGPPPMEAICGVAYSLGMAALGHSDEEIFSHLDNDHEGNLNHANLCNALHGRKDVKEYTRETGRGLLDALLIMGCMLKYAQNDENQHKGVPKVVEHGIKPFGDEEASYAMRFAAAALRQAQKQLDSLIGDDPKCKAQLEEAEAPKPKGHQFISHQKGVKL